MISNRSLLVYCTASSLMSTALRCTREAAPIIYTASLIKKIAKGFFMGPKIEALKVTAYGGTYFCRGSFDNIAAAVF